MNPLTNVKNITKLSEQELKNGAFNIKTSWHSVYKDSAWIFIGGLPFQLSEGDVIAVFSQYGEIVNINLIRDRKTGKSKGFCFLCYADQRSTILAVDNLNGITLLKRIIRVDHVEEYKVPKDYEGITDEFKRVRDEGCAPKPIEDLVDIPPSVSRKMSRSPPLNKQRSSDIRHKHKKDKNKKKHKKEKKYDRSSDDSDYEARERRKRHKKSSSHRGDEGKGRQRKHSHSPKERWNRR